MATKSTMESSKTIDIEVGLDDLQQTQTIQTKDESPAQLNIRELNIGTTIELANQNEHNLTILQAIKTYPRAIFWSLSISAASIMDGYDYHIFSSLYAQPAFQRKYGTLQQNGTYSISAPWQAGINNASTCGSLIGLYCAGTFTDMLGFRKTLMLAMGLIVCLVFLQVFANSLVMFVVSQILMGIPLGIFQTVTCVYAVEVAPTCLRAFLTSFDLQMWTIGQLLATAVIRASLNVSAPWSYRLPFAVQWIWPLPLIVLVYFAPEAPGWFIRKSRIAEAKCALKRLATGQYASDSYIENAVTLMTLTSQHERKLNASTSYIACFKGTDLRRTLLVVFLFSVQILGGTTLRGYATFFFAQAGLPATWAFNMAIITYSLSVIGCVVAWFLMPYVKKRTLFLWAFSIITLLYFIMGGLGVPKDQSNLSWGVATCLLVNGFVAYVGMEPMIFALVPEIPSGLLRSKTVPVGRALYSIINIAASILTSYQLNTTAWAWGARTGFFWGSFSVIGLLLAYFYLPDINNRTIAEIDLLFETKVSARQFGKVQVHVSDIAAES